MDSFCCCCCCYCHCLSVFGYFCFVFSVFATRSWLLGSQSSINSIGEFLIMNSVTRVICVFLIFLSQSKWLHVLDRTKLRRVTQTRDRNCGLIPWQKDLNPLRPDIKMHIPLTVLHIFHMELVRRIWLNIKTFCPWLLFPLFSAHHLLFEQVLQVAIM